MLGSTKCLSSHTFSFPSSHHIFLLTFTSCPLNPPTSPGFLCPPSFLHSFSPVPPLPPPLGLSGYHASLIQTSWGFFHRANYRQLGAQRITFSVQGKAEARGERAVLWNTQILDREGSEVCVCACFCCIKCMCTCHV